MVEKGPRPIQAVDRFDQNQIPSSQAQANSKVLESNRPRILVVDRPRILVVDDERLIVDTMCAILEGAGFDVASAYDGWTALQAATSFAPDFLLSDVLMPRMNGVQLAIEIRRMYPAARIILFSGQAGISEILLEGQSKGFEFELVAKPIHPPKLIEKLRSTPE